MRGLCTHTQKVYCDMDSLVVLLYTHFYSVADHPARTTSLSNLARTSDLTRYLHVRKTMLKVCFKMVLHVLADTL